MFAVRTLEEAQTYAYKVPEVIKENSLYAIVLTQEEMDRTMRKRVFEPHFMLYSPEDNLLVELNHEAMSGDVLGAEYISKVQTPESLEVVRKFLRGELAPQNPEEETQDFFGVIHFSAVEVETDLAVQLSALIRSAAKLAALKTTVDEQLLEVVPKFIGSGLGFLY